MFPLLTVQTALIGHTPRCQLNSPYRESETLFPEACQSSSLWTVCQTSSPFICSIIMWIFAVLFGWRWRRSARVNTGLYSKAIWTVRCFYEALSGHKGEVATHAHLLCAGWTFSTQPIHGGRLVRWPCILWLPHVSTGIPPWGSYLRGPTQRTGCFMPSTITQAPEEKSTYCPNAQVWPTQGS